jgi:hypothetical protein
MLSTSLWLMLWLKPWLKSWLKPLLKPWLPAELLCLRPEIFCDDDNDDACGPCTLGKETSPSKTLQNEG